MIESSKSRSSRLKTLARRDVLESFRPLAESVAAEMERKIQQHKNLKERVKKALADKGLPQPKRFPD
jgi:hypothetical protein